jgi:sugar lactone lactonase YvrE
VDPQLLRYHQTGLIDTGFETPRGIALALDNTLYVAGDSAIRAFDADGRQQAETTLSGAPYCLTTDETGAIYAGLRDHVEVYEAEGQMRSRWVSLGENAYLTSIAVDGENVWVADAGNRAVVRYNPSGEVVTTLTGRDGSADSLGFIVPSAHFDVATTAGGMLIVTNPGRRRVELRAGDGKLQSFWGQASQTIEGFCGCCNPTDIALLPDGRVVTSEKGLPRVKIYNAEGSLECVVAAPDEFSARARGLDLAVAEDGRIMVLDPPARAVRIFAPKEQSGPEGR